MHPFLKFLLLPLAIVATTAAGSIFSELNNFLLFESKYTLDIRTVSWFSFAVNASVLVGIVPSLLYSKYGPKKTILIGGVLLTAAHILAAFVLMADLGQFLATIFMFIVGVVGGQGACIIFFSSLGAMLKQHSIICTSLINGLLFSYFLGSDTFHMALKYGVLTNYSLQEFLFIIAFCGALIYFACAVLFQKKGQSKSEEKSLAKGILLKRTVQLYALVFAAYLTMIFLLMISYQLDSYWGSRILLVILCINFLVPVVSFSLIGKESLNRAMVTPSETDRFMTKKGKSTSLKEAKNKSEFWLFIFSFAIMIGIARMVDENATIIALHNSTQAQHNQRTFQVFEVLGAFTTGVFLSLFRLHISPYALFMFFSFLLLCSQMLMFLIDMVPLALFFSVVIVAFVSGGSFTLAGIIAHEDYGAKHYNKILGIFMTGAAAGIFIFDELVFGLMYSFFSSQGDNNYKAYGKWNKYIFIVCILSSAIQFIMAIGAFMKTRKQDGNKDKVSDFVNF